MQEIPAISPDTMKLLDAAVEAEKPDLVVYTGDQIKGYGVTYKGKGKELENAVKSTVQKLLEPVTKGESLMPSLSAITTDRSAFQIRTNLSISIKHSVFASVSRQRV